MYMKNIYIFIIYSRLHVHIIYSHTRIYNIHNNILQFPCDLVHLNCVKWSFNIFQDHLCFTLGEDTIVVYGNAMFVNTFKHTRTHVNWLRCSYLIYNAYVCIQVISEYYMYIYSFFLINVCMYTFSCNKWLQSRNWWLVGKVGWSTSVIY